MGNYFMVSFKGYNLGDLSADIPWRVCLIFGQCIRRRFLRDRIKKKETDTMKKNRIKKFLLMMACVLSVTTGLTALNSATAYVYADEPASAAAALTAGDNFFDAKTRTLTVNFSAPAGTSANLIAVNRDIDGYIRKADEWI